MEEIIPERIEEIEEIKEIIIEQVSSTKEHYEKGKKMKKADLIEEYKKLCEEKNVPQKLTDAKMKKTKNSDLIILIKEMNGETVEQVKPIENKPVNKSKRKLAGEELFKLNQIAITILESAANSFDKKHEIIDIRGANEDFAHPEIKKKFISIYSDVYDDFPKLCNLLTHWGARSAITNGNILRARHQANSKAVSIEKKNNN